MILAISGLLSGIMAFSIFDNIFGKGLYLAILIMFNLVVSLPTGRGVVLWFLSLAIPLFIFHGILNSAYEISFWVFYNAIPLRFEGIIYASNLAFNFGIIISIAYYWSLCKRKELINMLVALKSPSWLLITLFSSLTISNQIQRRGKSIIDAQKARGIKMETSFFGKIKIVALIFIPLVTLTIIESENRAKGMIARGGGNISPQREFASLSFLKFDLSSFAPLTSLLLSGLIIASNNI